MATVSLLSASWCNFCFSMAKPSLLSLGLGFGDIGGVWLVHSGSRHRWTHAAQAVIGGAVGCLGARYTLIAA